MNKSMLELSQLRYYFADKAALDDITLTVGANECLVILGPSGCGKSTLLQVIAGLLPVTEGQICFNGTDITYQPAEKRHFALMFQDFALFPHLSVYENIMFGLVERGVPNTEARQRAVTALADLRLSVRADHSIWKLSGGEQQRVALARALVTRPRLLLLDEPFSSLDASLASILQAECLARSVGAGISAIVVTHDRKDAFTMADRIAVMYQGRLVQVAAPAQLLAAPASAWLARFIGYHNVTDEYVVPNHAVLIGESYPVATIRSIAHCVEGVTLQLDSTVGGRLSVMVPLREWRRNQSRWLVGSKIGVAIDEAALIRFNVH